MGCLKKSFENDFIYEAEHISNTDFFDNMERTILDHKDLFSLLKSILH